jgi:RimJ/RimL family protein N-acetyltransferase
MPLPEINLHSDRLVLRPLKLNDFSAAHGLTVDDAMRRFLGPTPSSEEDSFQRLLRGAGCWALFGFGTFAVIEKATGALIGTNGLFCGKRGLGEDFDPFPEAGWVIAADKWGQGFAYESAKIIQGWMDETHAPLRTVCIINDENIASVKIARRLGYHEIGYAVYKQEEIMRYARVQEKI